MEATYINLTGHEVHELRADLVIPADLPPLRIKTSSKVVAVVDGILHEKVEVYLASPLPEPVEHTYYIVSQLALNAICSSRSDIISPKQVVRWKDGPHKGTVKGCIGFRVKEK